VRGATLCAAGTRRSAPLSADQLIHLRDLWVADTPVNTILAEFRFSFARLHSLIALMGLPARRVRAHWVPSQTEIAVAAAAIRATWSDDERLYRASHITDPLPPGTISPMDIRGGG